MAVHTFTLPASVSASGYAAEIRVTQTTDEDRVKSTLTLAIWLKADRGFGDPFLFAGADGAANFEVNGAVIGTIPGIGSTPYQVYIPEANTYYQLRSGNAPASWTTEIEHEADGSAQAHIELEAYVRNDASHYYTATWDDTIDLAPIDVGNAYVGGEAATPYVYDYGWKAANEYIHDGGEWK